MNDLSNAAVREENNERERYGKCNPIPRIAIFILLCLFVIGLSVSLFILIVVHNPIMFLCFLLVSGLVSSFIAWNRVNWKHKASVLRFLHSFPDSDLASSPHGQLVKITGRFSTDFYITDRKSGIRALVKAGPGCTVVPLIAESKLVTTTSQCRILSPHLRKWLQDRNLSVEARKLRLEEGYIQEGSFVTVIGQLHKNDNIVSIVQTQELLSTGCLWKKLLLPVEVDGLIIGVSDMASTMNPDCRQQPTAHV